jgi:endonuclease/exonuclease/phosphatase (EEP) superfamily protein YafD
MPDQHQPPVTKPSQRPSKLLFQFQKYVLGLSVLLCATVSLCYLIRPDACAAVTIFPAWAWAAPGGFLAAIGWGYRTRRAGILVALIWLAFLFGISDEPRGLLRFSQSLASGAGGRQVSERAGDVRVISFNARGDKAAANEVVQYRPDIVLLQESPSQKNVKQLAHKLFGDDAAFIWSHDTSIIVHGTLEPVQAVTPQHLVLGRARLASGLEAVVISTRLHSPAFKAKLWTPDCWQEQRAIRVKHREQMERTRALLTALPSDQPIIMGGDFNSPAGDAVFRLIPARLHDSFREGGIGWGDTAFNHVPVLRVDQVWISDQLRADVVVARETVNSDHRMVICDLVVRQQPPVGNTGTRAAR